MFFSWSYLHCARLFVGVCLFAHLAGSIAASGGDAPIRQSPSSAVPSTAIEGKSGPEHPTSLVHRRQVAETLLGPLAAHNPLRISQGDGGVLPRPLRAAPVASQSLITPHTLDELHGPLLRRDLQILGAQSCAAASCHGGPQPGIAQPQTGRGNEYPLWFENDPHARSWRTLCSDQSVRMMRQLKIIDGMTIVDQRGFDNCLACHNTTTRYDEPRSAVARREGVGCEACHGPGEHWIGNHFQTGWSMTDQTHAGLVSAGDLYTRARMCASCHIGDKDRDMNHDIIAAGHPALRYELATFHAWQPKHWRDAEADDRTHYEAQLWLAGQVAATDATLSLIETRATEAHSVSEWPELASFDCASCHHSLGFKNDRSALEPTRRAVAPLSRWNDAGMRWMINYREKTGVATSEDALLRDALDHVREQMEAEVRPDPRRTADAARFARLALAQWLWSAPGSHERHALRSERLGKVVAAAASQPETWQSWESAVQFYLAAVAARESWPGGWNGPLYETAETLRYGLRYPEMRTVGDLTNQQDRLPTASRGEAMRLGIELAGWLGNVTLDTQQIESDPTYDLGERELDEMRAGLREIAERWKRHSPPAEPADRQPNDKSDPSDQTAPEPPPPSEPRPKRSLEELRKSLEALQGGDADGS